MRKYLLAAMLFSSSAMAAPEPGQSLADLSEEFRTGQTSSEDITAAFINRIAALDDAGPAINAVIALDPAAMDTARAMDAERKIGLWRGPMHGMPILVKDNIEVAGALPTTAGSLALKDNITNRDAPMIARLRAAGAVILGKTNLSEWANIRSENSTSGWSAIGDLTRNPFGEGLNACGSSSGSGAAMSASFAAAAIGTETDGSIVCPASVNGVVGFKPTLGLVSRRFIVPISHSQDTAGPMTRTVRDAAIMLTAMAGSDPQDAATADADQWRGDYTAGMTSDALKGMKIGVVRASGANDALLDKALEVLKMGGAELVPMEVAVDRKAMSDAEYKVLLVELKADLAAYLQALPDGLVPHKTLADIIAFNAANADTELVHFGQDIFELAEKQGGLDTVEYKAALATSKQLASQTLDRMLGKVDIIVAQTNGPAWQTTLDKGDKFNPPSASALPAIAGYPHLTVPMGLANGLPVGLSFIGYRWNDHQVLKAGNAYQILSGVTVLPPIEQTPAR